MQLYLTQTYAPKFSYVKRNRRHFISKMSDYDLRRFDFNNDDISKIESFIVSDDLSHIEISTRLSPTEYLGVYLDSYPNNCGLCILNSMYFNFSSDKKKDKEVFEFLEYIVQLIKRMGYSQVHYTATIEQKYIIKLLRKVGFKKFRNSEVVNSRSGSTINTYYLTFNK